jgi:hypothetical protein
MNLLRCSQFSVYCRHQGISHIIVDFASISDKESQITQEEKIAFNGLREHPSMLPPVHGKLNV